jgi:hypothetical protein
VVIGAGRPYAEARTNHVKNYGSSAQLARLHPPV